ncbi:MAG: hypothetical protein AB1705_06805, partial [Verrucomicrobiota bacterium]
MPELPNVPCPFHLPRLGDWKSAIQQVGNLYSLSGVVHRLNRSFSSSSAIQTVNNAVAMTNLNF